MKPFTEERPWGSFRQFTNGEPVTVKLLVIKAGNEFSLQKHERRSEFWRILSGHPTITLGIEQTEAVPGDEFEIGVGVEHRISAGSEPVEVLEIGLGEFDEGDIVRIKDDYGRA